MAPTKLGMVALDWAMECPRGSRMTRAKFFDSRTVVENAVRATSVAASSVFTKVSYPEMKKEGYDPNFACASIAVSAGIAMLIPPSLYAVIYGMLAQASIAKMLMAGVLPGILQAATLSLGIFSSYEYSSAILLSV